MKNRFTALHLSLASVLALAMGAAGGYFFDDEPKATAWKTSCPNVIASSSAREAADRLVGSADSVSARSTESATTNAYTSSCFVYTGEKAALIATAELGRHGDVKVWETRLSVNEDIGPAEDRKYFRLGDKGHGVSTPESAAIRLDCSPSGSTISETSLNVLVLSRSSDHSNSHRADLLALAVTFAQHAQSTARCTDPVQIPSTPPALHDRLDS